MRHRRAAQVAIALCALGCAAVAGAGVFRDAPLADPQTLLGFLGALAFTAVGGRILGGRRAARAPGRESQRKHVLLLGTGRRACEMAQAMSTRPELRVQLVGCLDDEWLGAAVAAPYLGRLGDLPRVLASTVVDEVLVALPMRSSYERIHCAMRACEEQGVPVTLPGDVFPLKLMQMQPDRVAGLALLRLAAGPTDRWALAAKRVIDLGGALELVIALAPLMLCVALAVRLTSPGPVLFRQVRVGRNKRPFTFYKFRTMVIDAEARQAQLESRNEASGPVFKLRNDPRLTPIGAFLRRTSLDELPQLFNVIAGDMSLVGPRPLPLRDVQGFREDWQRRRFSVLPGITCLWQIGGRSDVSFEKWMALDLEYIDRWTLALDLGILLRTVPAVLRRKGAY